MMFAFVSFNPPSTFVLIKPSMQTEQLTLQPRQRNQKVAVLFDAESLQLQLNEKQDFG